MSKKVLMVATVPSMIGQFNMNNIRILQNMGYEIHVAADFTDTSVWTKERIRLFIDELDSMCIRHIQIEFSRSMLRIDKHISSFLTFLNLLKKEKYLLIHTHTPIASAIARIAALITGTKVIYTAHGFHFYKGAPLKNWLVFYPVEWLCSFFTDVLITINKEDYRFAKRHIHAKKVMYVPGVGIDTKKFRNGNGDRIRKEFAIDKNELMLLSVGELNENKNHETVIRALVKMQKPLVYVIVGKGDLKKHLQSVADESGVKLILTGYRSDVVDFYDAADIYCLPSIREGLNVSVMEAMASGLPVACGKIRGNVDLIDKNGGFLFDPQDVNDVAGKLKMVTKIDHNAMGQYNQNKIEKFSVDQVGKVMSKIYNSEQDVS